MFRRSYLRSKARQRVLVHLDVHDDSAADIEGVLLDVHADVLELSAASMLPPNGGSVPLDGTQLVPRDRVKWVQVLPAEVAP